MTRDNFYHRTRLKNGLLIVTEEMPGVRSVSLGLWIKTGSRDEQPSLAGITHFLEHLVFKGTKTRTARDIAEIFDSIGGELNAFSAKEYTCLYARVLDEHMDIAVDVLADLALNPVFRQADIDSERTVVMEEINMHEDAPAELVHDIFDQTLFTGHPLGPRIIGREDTVRSMTRRDIISYWKSGYTAPNIVVAAAGNVGHNKLVEQIEAVLGRRQGGENERENQRLRARSRAVVVTRDTQQAHICYGGEGMCVNDRNRFALSTIDVALGGGMSSRLFQKIREKRGLVYSVYSFRGQYSETGSLAVYAGTAPENAVKVVSLIQKELNNIAEAGITRRELKRAKEQLKGSLVLGLEDVTTRMSRLGRISLYNGEILSVDELIERVDAVTIEDTSQIAAKVLKRPRVLTVIGPFEKDHFSRFFD